MKPKIIGFFHNHDERLLTRRHHVRAPLWASHLLRAPLGAPRLFLFWHGAVLRLLDVRGCTSTIKSQRGTSSNLKFINPISTKSWGFILFTILEVLQKRWRTSTDSSQCQLRGKPSTPRLASSALGYLATSSLTLGLKLHSVHFADKFSSASQARLRRT